MDVAAVNKETKQMFEELTAALESPDTEVRRTKVAELLSLPKPQDIPRPGQARNWGLRPRCSRATISPGSSSRRKAGKAIGRSFCPIRTPIMM